MKKQLLLLLAITMMVATTKAQIIYTIAGNGTQGYSGDANAATSASLNTPTGVAVDAVGNVYIADWGNNVIRKVDTSGVISTVAGNGTQGYSGDGGAATSASLNLPQAVVLDVAGNIFILDRGNQRIRKVNTSGVISTVAGNGNASYSGDGGAATSASLNNPRGLAVDAAGNVYIADWGNNVIRKVNTSGVISTIAGNGTQGYSGDGGAATSASLYRPRGVAIDVVGNVYIADGNNSRIRKVTISGIISTVAGNGTFGYSGDGGAATSASLNLPFGVALDATGNIYIADNGNNGIRKVSTSGVISTVVGNGTQGYSGDGGVATSANLNSPTGLAIDAMGNVYIADWGNNVIREVINPPSITSFTPTSTCPNSTSKVFITGNNFTGVKAVTISGKPVSSFTVNSATSITAILAPNITGLIKVITAGGDAISVDSFTNNTGYTEFAYIANNVNNTVSALNTTTNTVTANITVGNRPYGVSVSRDGTRAYVTNSGSNTVSIINTITNTVIATIPVGLSPQGICVSPDGKSVYVTNYADNTLSIINSSTNTVITTLYGFSNPYGISITPDGTKLYVANGGGSVSIINTSTNSIIASIIIGGGGLTGICVSPDGTMAYVTNYSSNIVSAINTTNNTVKATFVAGVNSEYGVCFSLDGTKAYIANTVSGTVSIINTATNAVTATVAVGMSPYGVSTSSDGSKVYVVNSSNSSLSVISTTTNALIATIRSISFLQPFSMGNFIANVPTPCGKPTPVKITTLEAYKKYGTIQVTWQTATELNTSHFIIQHSTNGSSFTDIGTVKAVGSGANEYQFTDETPTNGINYYRLKSVDKDGSSSYSKVVSFQLSIGNCQLSIAPNPARDLATIKGSHIASVQVVDNIGRLIKVVSLKDATNPTFSVTGLPAGYYHLNVLTTDGKVSGVGFIKQ